jgi:hypothetical protein
MISLVMGFALILEFVLDGWLHALRQVAAKRVTSNNLIPYKTLKLVKGLTALRLPLRCF